MPRFAEPAKPWRGGAALRDARTCYDHLAGRLGVALADALAREGYIRIDGDSAAVTESGAAFFSEHRIALPRGKRRFCRACLDWSERRPHLAGTVGGALAAHAFAQGWVHRIPGGGRALMITEPGRAAIERTFGVRLHIL